MRPHGHISIVRKVDGTLRSVVDKGIFKEKGRGEVNKQTNKKDVSEPYSLIMTPSALTEILKHDFF